MDIRRVVTGHDANGRAVFVSDERVPPIIPDLLPGNAFHRLWGADEPPHFPDDGSRPDAPQYFPPVGGFRFGFFTIPPDGGAGAPPGLDMEAALADLEGKLPGLAGHMEIDNPGMHTTATVDFEVVLSGTCTLELDDGATVDRRSRRHRRPERHPPPVVEQGHRALPCSRSILLGAHHDKVG